jgi:AraC-like DNA-binding protein
MPVLPTIKFEGIPRGLAYESWREEFCRKVISCDIEPIGDGPFKYEVSPFPLTTSVALSTGGGSSLSYRTLANDDKLVLLMPDTAPLAMQMAGREMLVMPGQFSFGDSGIHGATATQTTEGCFSSVIFDRKTLLASCPGAEDLIARPAEFDAAAFSLLRSYYDIVRKEPHPMNAATGAIVGQHLLDLTVLMLGADRDLSRMAELGGGAAARFEVLKKDILSAISDPGLNVAALAAKHRLSIRYVQYLFERAGTSFTDFVLEQRLALAMRLLKHPLHAHRKVADIAHLSGFNSISYFHRAFRQRFDMTPTDARVAAKSESP